MRTTLILDQDLARQLRLASRRQGTSFQQVVNDTLRLGLRSMDTLASDPAPFVVKPKACGFRTGIDPGKLNQLVDTLDVEDFQSELLSTTHEE